MQRELRRDADRRSLRCTQESSSRRWRLSSEPELLPGHRRSVKRGFGAAFVADGVKHRRPLCIDPHAAPKKVDQHLVVSHAFEGEERRGADLAGDVDHPLTRLRSSWFDASSPQQLVIPLLNRQSACRAVALRCSRVSLSATAPSLGQRRHTPCSLGECPPNLHWRHTVAY